MYSTFIVFFISLLGIVVMIARKMIPIRAGKIAEQEFVHPFVPDLIKAKNFTYKNIKKYEHMVLVATLRFYVKSVNILKARYDYLRKRMNHGEAGEIIEEKEANKFLKMITDYKHRIRHIKTRIEEEEGE